MSKDKLYMLAELVTQKHLRMPVFVWLAVTIAMKIMISLSYIQNVIFVVIVVAQKCLESNVI